MRVKVDRTKKWGALVAAQEALVMALNSEPFVENYPSRIKSSLDLITKEIEDLEAMGRIEYQEDTSNIVVHPMPKDAARAQERRKAEFEHAGGMGARPLR